MRTHQLEDTWQLQYSKWLQQCCAIMTKMKDKLMVQDIGIRIKNRKKLSLFAHETLHKFLSTKLRGERGF